jgi:hypothetical protein
MGFGGRVGGVERRELVARFVVFGVAAACVTTGAGAAVGESRRLAVPFGLDPVFSDGFDADECAPWSATTFPICAPDFDLDLFGDESQPTVACELPVGHVANLLDCDDFDSEVHPGAPDLCNGIDDDCEPATLDGVDDPQVSALCDGDGDTDSCLEGTFSCGSGALVCSDVTSSTAELCAGDAVDEDCDGDVDEGFILDGNPVCLSATDLGTISGDSGDTVLSADSFGEKWYIFRVTEDVLLPGADLKIEVSLSIPVGIDFDLYLYCQNCSGSPINSSTLRGLAGHTDSVHLRRQDVTPTDQSYLVVAEIRHFASNRCAHWSLEIARSTASVQDVCP